MKVKTNNNKKRIKFRLVLIMIILLSLASAAAAVLYLTKNRKPSALEGPYPVAYVYDGDTISVIIGKRSTSIRIIGIDTPESVNQDQSKNTPEGMEVSLWLHDYLNGRKVWLEYDEQRYDRYGRTLAYIWLDEGETMLEDVLLKNGMAIAYPIEPNTKYSSRFREFERQAEKDRTGFWETGFFK